MRGSSILAAVARVSVTEAIASRRCGSCGFAPPVAILSLSDPDSLFDMPSDLSYACADCCSIVERGLLMVQARDARLTLTIRAFAAPSTLVVV
jgi:hypothetical protein